MEEWNWKKIKEYVRYWIVAGGVLCFLNWMLMIKENNILYSYMSEDLHIVISIGVGFIASFLLYWAKSRKRHKKEDYYLTSTLHFLWLFLFFYHFKKPLTVEMNVLFVIAILILGSFELECDIAARSVGNSAITMAMFFYVIFNEGNNDLFMAITETILVAAAIFMLMSKRGEET